MIKSILKKILPRPIIDLLKKLRNQIKKTKAYARINKFCVIQKAKKAVKQWDEQDEKYYHFCSQFIKNNDLVFDVGANVGLVSKVFLKLNSKVIAVEPQNECIACLKEAFKGNNNIVVVEKALGAAEGKTEIMQTSASTIASMSKDWIESVKKSGRFSEYKWEKKQEVQVTTLDNLIEQFGLPSFIKIDVEGYEYEVIKGLSKPVKAISLELTPEFIESAINCINHLSKIGNYSFNYASAKSLKFVLDKNATQEEIKNELLNYKEKYRFSSDLYCILN